MLTLEDLFFLYTAQRVQGRNQDFRSYYYFKKQKNNNQIIKMFSLFDLK